MYTYACTCMCTHTHTQTRSLVYLAHITDHFLLIPYHKGLTQPASYHPHYCTDAVNVCRGFSTVISHMMEKQSSQSFYLLTKLGLF
jgi:hypothetical protein